MNNPFFTDYKLPYDAVPFSKFKSEDFIPAVEKSIEIAQSIKKRNWESKKWSQKVGKWRSWCVRKPWEYSQKYWVYSTVAHRAEQDEVGSRRLYPSKCF